MSSKADTNSHIDENDTLEKIQLIDSNEPSGKFSIVSIMSIRVAQMSLQTNKAPAGV